MSSLSWKGRTRLRVAMVWGDRVVQDEVFQSPDLVRVGERPDECHFVVSDRRLPPCFELFRPVPGGFVLRVTDAVVGQLFVAGQQIDLERFHAAGVSGSVVGEVPLARGDHGVVSVGPVAFVFHFAGDGMAMPALSLARSFDRSMAPALLAALLLHGAVLVASRLAPVELGPMQTRIFEDRRARLLLSKPIPKRPAVDPPPRTASSDDTAGASTESAASAPAAPKPGGLGDGPGAKGPGAAGVLRAGLLSINDLLGDVEGFSRRLDHSTDGEGFASVGGGASGWDIRGLPGGGGAFGTRYAMGGIPGGRGPGAGPAGKGPGQRKRRPVVATVTHSRPAAAGACDPAEVRRVVKTRSSGVRFCYEKQLLRDHELAGKLTVTWRIGPDGRVGRAYVSDDKVGNAKLARCVVKQVRRWRFPKPKAGAACVIQYPFVFSSGR